MLLDYSSPTTPRERSFPYLLQIAVGLAVTISFIVIFAIAVINFGSVGFVTSVAFLLPAFIGITGWMHAGLKWSGFIDGVLIAIATSCLTSQIWLPLLLH